MSGKFVQTLNNPLMKSLLFLLISSFFIGSIYNPTLLRTLTGNIINEQGDPIRASVHAGKTQVRADVEGNYSIKLGNEAFLQISATGYKTERVRISKQNVYNIIMKRVSQKKEDQDMVYNSIALQPVAGVQLSPLKGRVSSVMMSPGYVERETFNTEEYDNISENGFKKVGDYPLSTFSIDVDAASYSNVRRFLENGKLPPAGAVRTEEMINYFKYDYPQPTGKDPFSINTELSECPWNKDNKLLLIGLQGKEIPTESLPASNLVFLIDVSGSMMGENRLPLVKKSLKLLIDQLREKDVISIVVYAGSTGIVLNAASGDNKETIKNAIDKLEAGGSTAGGAGIQLAYKLAYKNFRKAGNSRVILCTDGDFNVGASSNDELIRIIEMEREKGIYLTILGYGMGNYKDNKMQLLADKGNGNHAYIDGLNEAKKVLVNEFGGTLFTIAKDVKLQVEFNPEKIAGYRLIGYENRLLNKEDFNDDKKDAGELGSGHTVTALYEIIPAGISSSFLKKVDPLRYSKNTKPAATSFSDEFVTIKFRYKSPDGGQSKLIVHTVKNNAVSLAKASDNFCFAASVAGFGMMLRNSEFKGVLNYNQVISLANGSLGNDVEGYRKEYISLVKKAEELGDL